MRGVAAYGEALLCETAQAGPGVQFFAAITFRFLSDLCIFAGPSFPSTTDTHPPTIHFREGIWALFSRVNPIPAAFPSAILRGAEDQ